MFEQFNTCLESIKDILKSIEDIEIISEPTVFECSLQKDLTLICSKHVENPIYKVVDLVVRDNEENEWRLMLFIGGDIEDLKHYAEAIEKTKVGGANKKNAFNKLVLNLIKNSKCEKLYPVLVDKNIVIGGE